MKGFVPSYDLRAPPVIIFTLDRLPTFYFLQGVPHVLIVLSGGPPSGSLGVVKEISSSLKKHTNIWAIGSGPSISTQYLDDIASNEKQSHKTLLFENLFSLVPGITGKVCSGMLTFKHVELLSSITFNSVTLWHFSTDK